MQPSLRRRAALQLLLTDPVRVAHWCGLELLTEELHGPWLRRMLCSREDMTLLAHRGSYKTSCLAFAMAAMLLLFPRKNILFMRKTDPDVTEVLRQVKMLLRCDAMQYLSQCIWETPVPVLPSDMFTVQTGCYAALRGAPQLLGMGTGSSLTGKHADIVITDDIVNLQDRVSVSERRRICGIYQELQNIRNRGGRIINTGTPWHPEDAISLMPNVSRFDCRKTGLLSPEELLQLQKTMSPALFAANYELKHIAEEGALFPLRPETTADASLLRDGMAHVDAAYGGSDYTALTCGRLRDNQVFLYGRMWPQPIDQVMDEIIAECDRLMCAPILCETNGDKGYVAREMRRRGAPVRTYQECANKHVKIATWLRKWWPQAVLLEGTDTAWLDQVLEYTDSAAHDDAPDSAASLLRALDRRS